MADGPLDMTMMYAMHHAFRRDLRRLTRAAEATPVRARLAWSAMDERWQLYSLALHHHHSGEDAGIWPLLRQRVSRSELAVLDAMAAEHALIDPFLEACARGFATMATGGSEPVRAALVEALRGASDLLDSHLAHEETEAIPLMQQHITPAEDERIEREHFRAGVPLRTVLALVPWLVHELSADARAHVFRTTGPVYRLIWLLTRRRFERADREVMRHA